MFEIRGSKNTAKIFTDNVEQECISQIYDVCNDEQYEGNNICVMPDCHAGKGCIVGLSMTIGDKLNPSLIGPDIGCGMFAVKLVEKEIDLIALDEYIKTSDISKATRDKEHKYIKYVGEMKLHCLNHINFDKSRKSLGTLGGGNHFIEVDKDSEGNLYLVIHSGSRHLGGQIAKHYTRIAYRNLISNKNEKEEIIRRLTAEGKQQSIQEELNKLPKRHIDKAHAYLENQDKEDYLWDMCLGQWFAEMNREAIADDILQALELHEQESFHTVHNYVHVLTKMLRKGAISAHAEEKLLIPLNMRDGAILGTGKGNVDWNCTAPHGAGRLYSRSKAREVMDFDIYKDSMEGIYTTSVTYGTIDEAPDVYKPMQEIIDNISETVDIIEVIKPIYNYKNSEEMPSDDDVQEEDEEN